MWGDDMDVNTLQNVGNGCRLSFINKRQNGFTLLELIITLAVIAILSVTLSSVSASFISSNKVSAAVNKIASDMSYARTEAISRNQNVELCKTLDGITCSRTNQWEKGWMIFVDENRNRRREANEERLKHQPAVGTVNITYRGTGSSHYIRFRSDGATGVNGTFAFCADSIGDNKKALILFRTGRLRLSKTRSGGRPISCASYRN